MAQHPPASPRSAARGHNGNGPQPQVVDVYPAGAADSHHHHGHTIISGGTLLGVLILLLALTFLTVGASQFETFVASTFDMTIPQWINVAVALSIAVVKTTLVVLYFMQLKYDNPLNSMIFIFTLITVSFFLGFTLIDLGTRGSIYDYKSRQIVPGGTGGVGVHAEGMPVTQSAREAALQAHPGAVKPVHRPYEHHAAPYSTPSQSRPVVGLTLPGYAEPPAEGAAPPDDHH